MTFPCPRCHAALPPEAAFCDACGADVRLARALGDEPPAAMPVAPALTSASMRARPGFVAVGRGMSVCHGCGALAPTERTSCEVCGAAIGTSLEAVPARQDGLSFAQVRVQITCRQCGGTFPLDEPELGEAVTCPRCSTIQAFDADVWRDAFAEAHTAADVYGPRGASFRATLQPDPHPAVGRSTCVVEFVASGIAVEGGVMRSRNLRAACAPGQPLCAKCGSPRDVTVAAGLRAAEELHVRCVGCGDQARYGIPSEARGLGQGIVGFLAEGLRVDRPEARLDATSAGQVIALRCPSCGGGLTTTPGSNVAVCAFCKTEARIASRTLLALKSSDGAPRPWWVVFRGDAAGRRAEGPEAELALAGLGSGGRDDDEEQLLRMLAVASAPGSEKMLSAAATKIESPKDASSAAERRREWAFQIVVPLIALVVVLPFFAPRMLHWLALESSTGPTIVSAGPSQTPTPSVPIVLQVLHEGEWRPVCDDGFGIEEANVACRQMGFQGASSFSTTTGTTDSFWLDDVVCSGTEPDLGACGHAAWGDDNCSASETQAVTCH